MSVPHPYILAAFGLALSACAATPTPHDVAAPPAGTWEHVSTGDELVLATGLRMTAHWDSFPLPGPDGAEAGFVSATSYFLTGSQAVAERPVVFLFNGGPGASSSPLHFSLGPRLRERGNAETTFPDNASSIIDAADLVFIDPVETGFSRAASEEANKDFLGVSGDADSISAFIRAWLKEHDRESSSVFLVGQSYGGYRLTQLLPRLDGVPVRGLVMVSPMLDAGISSTDMGNVFALPTMAATAWRFGKSSLVGTSEEEAWLAARDFAETDYLLALQKGDTIPDTERRNVAAQLAAMTGLEAGAVADANLRIDIQYFLENVLAGDDKLVSRLNTGTASKKAPAANPDRPAAANDPSLGLGKSNMIVSEDIASYLKQLTGVERPDGYRSLNLEANFIWNWSAGRGYRASLSGIPELSDYMKNHTDTELVVFGGYRDLAIPLLGLDYTLSHAGLPQDRVTLVPMLGGHSPYDERDLLPEFAGVIRELITEQVADIKMETVQ